MGVEGRESAQRPGPRVGARGTPTSSAKSNLAGTFDGAAKTNLAGTFDVPPRQTWLTSLTCRSQHFYRETETPHISQTRMR